MSEEMRNEALAALDGQVTATETGNNAMAAALSGVEGKITLAPDKIPAGKTLVAIWLARSGMPGVVRALKQVVEIQKEWIAPGKAVAIRGGHIVAAATVFGHCSEGVPKVTACHWLKCPACGRRVLEPVEVWAAKDLAEKRNGVRPDDGVPAKEILAKWASCPCGGKWETDREGEKESLSAFGEEVFAALSAADTVPKFLPPRAFRVGTSPKAQEDMGEEWAWLAEIMRKAGSSISNPEPLKRGAAFPQTIVYNPTPEPERGFWWGWVDNPHDTGLFWVEGTRGERRRRTGAASFDLGAVDGL